MKEGLSRVDSRYAERRLITGQTAEALRDAGKEVALAMKESCFFLICDPSGLELTSLAVGPKVRRRHCEIARAKMQTVLNVEKSTSVQAARMADNGQSIASYAGQVETDMPGGVALFDRESGEFVGAIAVSGAPDPNVDEKIAQIAAEMCGLTTDLGPLPEEALQFL